MSVGSIVGGRFELLGLAGRGGMGEVWRARDRDTGATVAMKRMLAHAGADRFAREASLVARVEHAALIRYVAHGEDEVGSWLAISWVDGETLAARLCRAPLSVSESLTLVGRVAGALDALHRAGIVHRDVKPENIMLAGRAADGAILLDLGIARSASSSQLLTGTNMIIGTLGYMAPEQALSGRDVDSRADVFALGSVLFECLTGEPLYTGQNVVIRLARLLTDVPRRPRELVPELPAEVDDLVAAMLAREPSERIADGAAVLGQLARMSTAVSAEPRWAPRARPAITVEEQRLALAVVIDLGTTMADADTVAAAPTSDVEQIRSLARRHGVEIAVLGGQTVVVLVEGNGTVADRAEVAATITLSILRELPELGAGLAAGLAVTHAPLRVGEVLERAIALSRAVGRGTLRVDPVSRELLSRHFQIARDSGDVARRVEAVVATRRVLGRAIPFVGRDKEVALIEATLAETLEEGTAHVIQVIAPAGTGKSRLAGELGARWAARPDLRVIEGAATAAKARAVHHVIANVLRRACGLGASPTAGDHQRVRAYASALRTERPERFADFLGELAEAPTDAPGTELTSARNDAETMAHWVARTVREWLVAESARAPLIVVLEDMHWADVASIRRLGEALGAVSNRALLVVMFARPELSEVLPEPWPRTFEVRLSGLGAKAAEKMVRAVLGDASDASMTARLIERAGGNPLFLEELIRFVSEGRGEQMPATVLDVLHARLGSLGPELRRVLRVASVLGGQFALDPLVPMLASTREAVAANVEALVSGELVVRESEPGVFAFRHALVRDAAYAMLTDEDRRQAHVRAADWVETQAQPDPYVMVRHLEATDARERLITWLTRATWRAFEARADEDLLAFSARAFALGATGVEAARLQVLVGLAQADITLAAQAGQLAFEHLVPGTQEWILAVGLILYGAAASGDLQSVSRALMSWIGANFHLPPTRSAYFAAAGAIAGLGALRMGEQADAVRAACGGRVAERSIERAWQLVACCAHDAMVGGRLGGCRRDALAALDIASDVGDLFAMGQSQIYAFAVVGFYSRSPRMGDDLREASQLQQKAPIQYASAWLKLFLCAHQARATGELQELRALGEAPDRILAETAQLMLLSLLNDGEAFADALVQLPACSFMLPFAAGAAELQKARAELGSGAPDRALATLHAIQPSLLAASYVLDWETFHATRIEALLALDRVEEARDALPAALARLDVTLEGADELLLEMARSEIVPTRKLLGLAERLGVSHRQTPIPSDADS